MKIEWLGYKDSNLGMAESESAALPLGYTPICIEMRDLVRVVRFELAHLSELEPESSASTNSAIPV